MGQGRSYTLLFVMFLFTPLFAYAGNIDSTNKYARFLDSSFGLINFGATQGNVTVTNSAITGYAWGDYVGWINLNPTNGGVTNDGYGNLSGYAWGEQTGWINFKPTNGGVTIDASGNFNGYAWSETKGWIVFNCATDNTCGTLSHKVQTSWVPISALPACSNTIDDDGDGKIDYPADPGCTSASDTSEVDPVGGGGIVSPPPPAPSPPPPSESAPPPPPPSESVPPGVTESPSESGPGGETSQPQGGGEETGVPAQSSGTSGGTVNPPESVNSGTGSEGGFVGSSPIQVFVEALHAVTETLSPQAIIENTKQGIEKTNKVVQQTRQQVKHALETPEGDTTSKTITTTGVVTGGATSFLSLAVAPFSLSEFLFLPLRLWALLLSALGIKRRHRPWGTVYDSVTKQPLDPAYVVLQTLDGKEVATAITDLDGRYGFFISPGTYRVAAHKTNYRFPSSRLAGKTSDEFYEHLYFGDPIIVDQSGVVVARDIPMDPEGFDWNEYAKRAQHLMKFYSRHTIFIERLTRVLFRVGFVTTFVALVAMPTIYNTATFVLYLIVGGLRMAGPHGRPHGVVLKKETGDPAAFSFLTVTYPNSGIEVKKSVADVLGRYYCLVPKGTYRVGVSLKNEDDTYTPTVFSSEVQAPRGIIRKKIEV
jgi:hypothetical protein